ncbi:MAG TPA: 1-(5-phosphoribosyl)-5-[(5-phosphoribosylamino)methylideneamino]imidazole-4-carboxamide isomerase [Acidimicrobiales bacterium]|nr:1-(5-phosphoribosyl)-5-[(5-phosphoribosylamino)methylideneamino]imidazole-4-carboxamide isomerase [Acidimicrobiales bacterium]
MTSFDLYPSIDLRGGRVVRLHQGDFDQETVYGDDPLAVARSFESAGARWIHVVDLDAARRTGSNRDIVVAVSRAVSVPVQTGGGVRDASLLEDGVARIVVGSAAVEDPDLVRRLADSYPGRVAVGLDHWDGEVKVRGWEEGSGRQLLEVAGELALPGVAAFVVTDISRDATLVGPDIDGLADLHAATAVPVIASGGVGSLDDLAALRGLGLAGAIVGKAIYEGRFGVDEAVLACAR